MTGLMAVIMIYGLIVARGLRTALQCREPFGKLLAAGLSFAFALQVFTIIGGVTRLLPLTGLTTPFMSQGGSSLICNWIVVALLLVITHQVRKPAVTVTALDPDVETTQLVKAAEHDRVRAVFALRASEARSVPPGGTMSEHAFSFAKSDDGGSFESATGREGQHLNKPIRRVAFVAMIMFALLLANGTYMMIFRQSCAGRRAAEPAGPRRRVRPEPRARSWPPARPRSPRPSRPTTRSSTSGSTPTASCTPRSPASTPTTTAGTALESTYNSQLAGTDDALFVRRLIDMVTDRTPQGASVQTTIVPKVQKAAAEALGDQKRRGGRPRPADRGGAGHGDQPELRPERHRQPRHRGGRQGVRPAGQRPGPAAVQPGRPGDLSARVDVQAGHRSGRAGRREDPRHQGRLAGPAQAARHQRLPRQLRALRRTQGHHDPGAQGVLQHRVRQPRS